MVMFSDFLLALFWEIKGLMSCFPTYLIRHALIVFIIVGLIGATKTCIILCEDSHLMVGKAREKEGVMSKQMSKKRSDDEEALRRSKNACVSSSKARGVTRSSQPTLTA